VGFLYGGFDDIGQIRIGQRTLEWQLRHGHDHRFGASHRTGPVQSLNRLRVAGGVGGDDDVFAAPHAHEIPHDFIGGIGEGTVVTTVFCHWRHPVAHESASVA